MRRGFLVVVLALTAATVSVRAQVVSVTVQWHGGDPTHYLAAKWEVDADGLILPCVDWVMSPTVHTCRVELPVKRYERFRLRGLRYDPATGAGGPDTRFLIGDWSVPMVVDLTGGTGVPPGPFTLGVHFESVVQTPLLTNGGFEASSTAAVGWTVAGNVRVTGQFGRSEGLLALAFNVGQTVPNGTVRQAVTVSPGAQYRLTFTYAPVSAVNRNTQSLRAQVLAGTTSLVNQTVSRAAVPGTPSWATATYTFTATSTSVTVLFTDVSPTTSSVDLLLDNVKLELIQAASGGGGE